MAVGKEIKNRIKSVKNTKKITKAMELVAASKMKRAVTKTLDARNYAKYSWQILESIGDVKGESEIVGKKKEISNKTLAIIISSNKGLCGAYNAQILRKTMEMLREAKDDVFEFASIGKKGDVALRRLGQKIVANFDIGETVNLRDASPVCDFIFDKYKSGEYKKIVAIYTDFISALNQKPHLKQILPFEKESQKETLENMGGNTKDFSKQEFLFEPGQEKILEIIVPKIAKMQIYHMLLEGQASEQSSRMIAMKNASEAAGEMIEDLTLAFNKARQASITQEISEISAGMASVS